MTHKIKIDQTIHITIRKLKDDQGYIIIGYHHHWNKSHALNPSYPFPKSRGIVLKTFGDAFGYVKKYMSNAILKPKLNKPLASSDYFYNKIADNEESIS